MRSLFALLCIFVATAVGQQVRNYSVNWANKALIVDFQVYYPDYYTSELDNEPYGVYSTFNYAYYRQYVTNLFDDDEGLNPDDDDDGADDDELVGGLDDDYFFDDDDLVRIDDDEQYDRADDDFENDRYVRYDSSASVMKPLVTVFLVATLAVLF